MTEEIKNEMPWLDIARKEIGVKEVAGNGDNAKIIEYHAQTVLKAQHDSVSWCSAFANWVFYKCNIVGTKSAMARSWLNWGKSCDIKIGAIVILKRGDAEWQGHVGFVTGFDPIFVKVLGGNQADEVNERRFFRKNVLGYRWPIS